MNDSDVADGARACELPLQRLVLRGEAVQPLLFDPRSRDGVFAGTTLGGALPPALREVACARRTEGSATCSGRRSAEAICAEPATCLIAGLVKPYSAVQKRAFPTPVYLRAPALETACPVTSFRLEVTLLGRRALAARSSILDGIHRMGHMGLSSAGRRVRVRFEIEGAAPPGTVRSWASELADGGPERLLLSFETPTLVAVRAATADTRSRRSFHASGPPPLVDMLGNVAYELAAWDLEDRGLDACVDHVSSDRAASAARSAARAAAEGLIADSITLRPASLGTRISRSSGHRFPLTGFVGTVGLRGELEACAPWLVAMTALRVGAHRSLGCGEVRIGIPIEPRAGHADPAAR